MSSIINTNSLSLLTQNNLNKSQGALNTAIERLSSGMRINSAKDDAAGQAIANRFTANIKGLTQASRNANDGISLAQTTEGALNEINNNLQRVRELSVQSANGSNSAEDKVSIQAEITQRMDEINRLSEQTDFNGTKVLSASAGKLSVQVGANDGETIDIALQEISAKTLGLSNLNITNKSLDLSKVATAATTTVTPAIAGSAASAGTVTTVGLTAVDTSGAPALAVYVDDANADLLYVSDDGGTTLYAAAYDNASGKLEFTSATPVVATATAATAGQQISDGAGATVNVDDVVSTDTNPAAAVSIYEDAAGAFYVSRDGGTNTVAATFATDGTVSYAGWAAEAAAPTDLSTALTTYEIPPIAVAAGAGTAAVAADLSGLSVASVGTSPSLHKLTLADGSDGGYVVKGEKNGSDVYHTANVGADGAVTLGEELTPDPLASIDAALSKVDELRGALGAVQNRFDSVISNLGTTLNNLSASRSRIEDADYATEVSNMTRANILQQAGTSVLAQANQSTQGVLSLLR